MNKELIKTFFIGGTLVTLCEYTINKYKKDGIKYAAIMSHGLPFVFLTTWLLLKDKKNKEILVREGIIISLLLAFSMLLLYILSIKNSDKYLLNLIISVGIYFSILYFYLKI